MIRPYSAQALEFKLGLEAGVIEPGEVIAWADRILETHEYDDDIANVSLATSDSRKEMMSLLTPLIDGADEWTAVRKTMARMYLVLLRDSSRAHDFTRFLESFWSRHGYEVPEDMSFMAGIEDEFQLAVEGIYGTVEDAIGSLMGHLARFKDITEPGDPPNDGPALPVENSDGSGGGRHR
jgi:hypothetical protein